ncbi:lysophospholipid acyltransferase family protein [Candidatus Nitrospira bockiana]
MKSALLNRLVLAAVPPVGATIIRLLGRSMRLETRGAEVVDDLYRQGRHIIIAFWHGRQLMMPLAYRGREAHILISQHRDGELIARVVGRFGLQAVRGSTTRGGVAALRQLIALGRSGVDLVVTPDGPKGPRHVVQAGVVQLAKATGMPIVPLTFGCSKKNSSRAGTSSWCRTRSPGACSCGESRSGLERRRMPPRSNRRGWHSRRPLLR